jgi:hypothetical protein
MRTGWIAALVAWLASPESKAISGRVFEAWGFGYSVIESWQHGPQMEASRDPTEIGESVSRIVGFARANAGIDLSNVDRGQAALLPDDPDRSARRIRDGIRGRSGVEVGVIVSDTFGRPWRRGVTDVAIGSAGLLAVLDLRGTQDAYGKPHPYAKITGANHPEFMESYDFGSNYHGGGVLAGQTQFLFPKESFAKDRNAFWNAITGDLDPTQAGVQGYYGATTSYQPLNPDGSVKMVQRRDPVTKEFVDVIDPVTGKSIPVAMVKDAPLMATGNEGNIWVLPQFRDGRRCRGEEIQGGIHSGWRCRSGDPGARPWL